MIKRKNLRMAAGIILHPFKMIWRNVYRYTENDILRTHAEWSENYKKWNRMHEMSEVTNTGYTTSELYGNIGCFACAPKGYES